MTMPTNDQDWKDRAEGIMKLIDVGTQTNDIYITKLYRGFTMKIGCVGMAFTELQEMMEWLGLYLENPGVFHVAYQVKINEKYQESGIPGPVPPSQHMGPLSAAFGGGTVRNPEPQMEDPRERS